MKGMVAGVVLWIGVAWSVGACAQVYRCVAAGGAVSFQDRACGSDQRQTIIDLPGRAPPGYVPPPVATAATPTGVADVLPPPVRVPPPAPLPVMYACVGAVNGKHYLTRSPPPPYLAPLGAMGYPPQSLSQAYGAPGGAGMSAPGMHKPRIGGPAMAAGMTEVEDDCQLATRAEVCRFVQQEYASNQGKLRMAMPSAAPPLARREQELASQLRNCR
ncbi:MAG: DUF4124 domain-containing protein [Rhodanobacteraceae bacterium]|nr:MAG: DUF4124 domain-containing protein [Rhodanobacteraceae bacterium]